MTHALLDIDRLSKSYGPNLVLDEVSVQVNPGEICGLLGPNGAGKSTLVSIVAGLRIADAGAVRIGGVDIGGGRATRGLVGLAGQETGVYPTVTVLENLLLFAGLGGLARAQRSQRIDELSEVFELTRLLDRQARNLSGGERRRLHTAMALLHRPQVLLLDEPTAGVDVHSRTRLLDAVKRLAIEDGCAIVYSTHYLPEIESLGATVAILDNGTIVTRGKLSELIEQFGQGSVSILFDGPAPEVQGTTRHGDRLTQATEQGGAALAEIIVQLGSDATRVRSVEIHDADLESVFRTLTGRDYRGDVTPDVSGTSGRGREPMSSAGST